MGKGKQKNQKARKVTTGNTDCDSLSKQLRKLGLGVKEMLGDGNCLFRALGDQYEGHSKNHIEYRLKVVEFIKSHRSEFEPFIEDDVPFDDHVKSLAEPGTYGGNDAIVAFSRIFNVTVVIHQCDSPPWVIHPGSGGSSQSNKELHISFHNGDHYNSVVKTNENINIQATADSSEMIITTAAKGQTSPGSKKEGKQVQPFSLPSIKELKIVDDNPQDDDSSQESRTKKAQPPKAVKQTRRKKLELKKRERKMESLQRKTGSSVDSSSLPCISTVTSTVKTLTI